VLYNNTVCGWYLENEKQLRTKKYMSIILHIYHISNHDNDDDDGDNDDDNDGNDNNNTYAYSHSATGENACRTPNNKKKRIFLITTRFVLVTFD